MKLVNSLVVAFLGTLMAAGCTVTDDAGTDGGTDAGGTDTLVSGDTAKTDTLTTGDTAPGETAGDTSVSCEACTNDKCKTESTACAGKPKCVTGVACLNSCASPETGTPADCRNTCVTNAAGDLDDLVTCINTNCKSNCGF